jgi:hypothetical protein
MIPHILHYTDTLPEGLGGTAQGPYIRIRPRLKNDKGIHAHELLHVAQWWVFTLVSAAIIGGLLWYFNEPLWGAVGAVGVYGALYRFVPAFAIWAEVQCYREQAKHYEDDRMPRFAQFMATKYRFKITTEAAEKRLRA